MIKPKKPVWTAKRGRVPVTVEAQPLLVRPPEAAGILGSVELLDDLVAAEWLVPTVKRKRLTLYSVDRLKACVARLNLGERLPEVSQTPSSII